MSTSEAAATASPAGTVTPVRAYAAGVTEREERLDAANPDLLVIPGQVKCFGCEVMDHGYGTRCTAVLTHPLYSVEGELAPRAAGRGGLAARDPRLRQQDRDPGRARRARPATTRAQDNGTTGRRHVRGGLRRLIGR